MMDSFECPKCHGIDKEVAKKLEKIKTFLQRSSYKDNPKHWDKHVNDLLTLRGTKRDNTFNVHFSSFLLNSNELRVQIFGQCELCNYCVDFVEYYPL